MPLVPAITARPDARPARGEAEAHRLPVLIKASAGGGGKGMRPSPDQGPTLPGCWHRPSARRKNSFGDDNVLIERYLQRPRHIEIQVFADERTATASTCSSATARCSGATRRSSKRPAPA